MKLPVLIVCEKPSQAKAVQTAVNSLSAAGKNAVNASFAKREGRPVDVDFTVIALHGHIMRAFEPADYKPEWGKPWRREVIPMIPEHFKFKVGDTDTETYNRMAAAVTGGKFAYVVNACDPDREGESIFWLPLTNTGYRGRVLRLYNHDATNEEYQKALANLLDYSADADLVRERNASAFRIMFDWLVGMNLSRLAAMRLNLRLSGGALAIGRVKTPVIAIVVKRDAEIAGFASAKYYELVADFGDFKARWQDGDGKTSVPSKAEADSIARLSGLNAVVTDVATARKKVLPPQMFSLSELQKAANRAHGYSAQKVLDTVQSLYEAGFVSYPRTDARVLTLDKAAEIPLMLRALSGIPEVAASVSDILARQSMIDAAVRDRRCFDNAKVTAHHALVNTKNAADMSKMTAEQKNIYGMIIRRFVGIFLPAYEYDETVVMLDMNGQTYKAVHKEERVRGWQAVTGSDEEAKPAENGESSGAFPVLVNGTTRTANEVTAVEKATKAPSAYTDASLIADMTNCAKFSTDPKVKAVLKDKGGLGTEATRASLIEDCVRKGLLIRKGRYIVSSPEAQALIQALRGLDLVAPDMTAVWETKLREVEDGTMSAADFRKAMNDYVGILCQQVSGLRSVRPAKASLGACPLCGADVRESAKGYYCSSYNKETNHSCWFMPSELLGAKITSEDVKSLLTGGSAGKKNFTSAKTGKQFKAALRLDADKKLAFEMEDADMIGKCPVCGRDVKYSESVVYCVGNRSAEENVKCGFHVFTGICGKQLTKKDMEALLNGETAGPYEFISKKTGRPFIAGVTLEDGKPRFVF